MYSKISFDYRDYICEKEEVYGLALGIRTSMFQYDHKKACRSIINPCKNCQRVISTWGGKLENFVHPEASSTSSSNLTATEASPSAERPGLESRIEEQEDERELGRKKSRGTLSVDPGSSEGAEHKEKREPHSEPLLDPGLMGISFTPTPPGSPCPQSPCKQDTKSSSPTPFMQYQSPGRKRSSSESKEMKEDEPPVENPKKSPPVVPHKPSLLTFHRKNSPRVRPPRPSHEG
jgi:hypothetical protein